jgi:hypothetical protein
MRRQEQTLRATLENSGLDTGTIPNGGGTVSGGIANTYYWSPGGQIAKQTQLSSVREMSFSSKASWEDEFGSGLKVNFNIAAADFSFSFEGRAILKWEGEAQRETKAEQTITLDVTNNLQRMLDRFDPVTHTWRNAPVPGQVKGYRYMAFYLPPDAANATAFEDIIDKDWLLHSNSPEAVVLRSANFKTGSRPFRVLYRVTHVERVPPEGSNLPDITADKVTAQPVDLDGNAILVDQILKQLGGNAQPTLIQLSAAIDAVLNVAKPQDSPLAKLIPWWVKFVEASKVSGSKASEEMTFLRLSMLNWFTRAYEANQMPSTVTPLPAH